MSLKILKATKQQIFKKRIFGFDIETSDNNRQFDVASIYSDEYKRFYHSKQEFIDDLKTNKIFRNAVIVATNLSFDYFGTFFTEDDQKNFYTLFRGSDLLFSKTHFYKNRFTKETKIKTKPLKSLMFIDSLNYAHLSVDKMGKILGIPKLNKPDFLGHRPKNKEQWDILKAYNLRDSEITYKFMKFLIPSFEKLGATFKNTIASTSMSLFKNKYLDDEYITAEESILLEQLESYYGGRTEALRRGYFKSDEMKFMIPLLHNHNTVNIRFLKDIDSFKISYIKTYRYYDFNSLYPSVMRDYVYPHPNSLRITHKNTTEYITKYEGCSDVEVTVPATEKYPLLPHRQENGRVIFPTGKLRGWYTHIELREAQKLGYTIDKVHKTHFFMQTCRPFFSFVDDLYNLRNHYKSIGSTMEYVVKITMNALYGKFSQRFLDRDNWVHESQISAEEMMSVNTFERKGSYIRISKDSEASAFCIPIWSSYIAAYGRIKLHKAIVKTDASYCDTDSLFTLKYLETSDKLGDLKLEMNISEGIIVRPKFYAIRSSDTEFVKIKGLGRRLTYFEFFSLISDEKDFSYDNILKDKEIVRTDHVINNDCMIYFQTVYYDKFMKFKEAVRRDFIPNEICEVHKEFSLEDQKRKWSDRFSLDFSDSVPLTVLCTEQT